MASAHFWETGLMLGSVVLAGFSLGLAAKKPKLKAEDLVSRHLESMGSVEARAAAKSRAVEGEGMARVVQGGHGTLVGPAVLLSEGNKLYLRVTFENQDYPHEEIACDGDTTTVRPVQSGQRPPLGDFLFVHHQIIEEGLLGGVLSTAWPLLRLEERRPKLRYNGLKKVGGQTLHRLEYRARKRAGDFKTYLYFEPESFRHVLTTYSLTIHPAIASGPIESARQQPTRLKLEESFGDFQQVDGLTLPFHWNIRLSREGTDGTMVLEWDQIFQRITHNQETSASSFRIEK